jgi:transcriptional regulator GlxA family with amidase domain
VQRVIFLALPDVVILDLAGPIQVFFEAQRLGAEYCFVSCASARVVHSEQGPYIAGLAPLPSLRSVRIARPPDLVIVPGLRERSVRGVDPKVLAWLRAVEAAGAHVASVCTGAFVLGAAGLLTGRRCTTHWSLCDELQRRFPAARVLADRLFVTDGRVTSSGGLTSGIDMALSLVELHHGPRLAAATARELVVYIRRDAARPQRSVYLDHRSHLHPGVHRVQDWLVEHASERPSAGKLAGIALMSQRHLTRVFRQATGISLGEYATRLRLELARTLIRDPALTLEAVAARCGFASARQLRRRFRAAFGASPSVIRASCHENESTQDLQGGSSRQ